MSSGAASDVGVRPSSNNNFVTRTYIGGGGNPSSSLAIKIHKRSLSRLASNPGSLTSLHETSLNSDVEDVRSSCSAYRPVARSFGETRSCVGGIRDDSTQIFQSVLCFTCLDQYIRASCVKNFHLVIEISRKTPLLLSCH